MLSYFDDESLSIIDIYSQKKFPNHLLRRILDITDIIKKLIEIVVQLQDGIENASDEKINIEPKE